MTKMRCRVKPQSMTRRIESSSQVLASMESVGPCLRGKFSGGGGEAVLAGTAQ